jgi:hypothetical protein
MSAFEILHRLVKSDRQKKEFQGPEIKKLLRKLPQLREFLPAHLFPFVAVLDQISLIYTISHATSVEKNHLEITKDFKTKWIGLMTTFGINMPLKVHIISEHLSEYFDLYGKTLRKASDQVVESAHHKLKSFFESRPNYNHKEKESMESGEATLSGVIHFNTLNI